MKVESWCHWECRSCCTKIGINKLVSGGCWANGNDITKLAKQEHQGSFSKLWMWSSIVKRGQSMSRTLRVSKRKMSWKEKTHPKYFLLQGTWRTLGKKIMDSLQLFFHASFVLKRRLLPFEMVLVSNQAKIMLKQLVGY